MNNSEFLENNNNNNNGNDNGFQRRINFSQKDIISFIEKLQLDKDKAITSYATLRIDYNTLQKDFNSLQSKYKSMEMDIKKALSKSSFAEIKLNENMSKLFLAEKKLSQITSQNNNLSNTNAMLENQLSKYKDIYADYKNRTNKEISLLKTNLEEIQNEKEELIKNNISIKKELNQIKLEKKLLEKENATIKNDNDSLIKIIEEHNDIVKTSEAKIISFDNTVNEYKKQIDSLHLEIEKLNLENKLQKEYNDKYRNNFDEKILISDNNFEEAINI